MPKAKLKSHHNGHSLTKGKGSIYQRSMLKREEKVEVRQEVGAPDSAGSETTEVE